jgi:hypothetical protein
MRPDGLLGDQSTADSGGKPIRSLRAAPLIRNDPPCDTVEPGQRIRWHSR